VRLQELFGLAATPRIAGGRLGLKLHLLSPARRPVQVTQDLASVCANTYAEVKKDLKGRYPKHYWPDDPLIAEPTARAKPRRYASYPSGERTPNPVGPALRHPATCRFPSSASFPPPSAGIKPAPPEPIPPNALRPCLC